eukprot:CAMPEP_0185831926 /NCGR_PEP_ID=MMETSP1353-20130828/1783_1 /TAXON_ID=1077150 /ORGANISM="Erythrolobus australicus, Strain CCMP3124" /LENGTH=197 /DNA_ID=CAMNT_0028530043 /DNA_START=355 /DNA_END=945 /DNA_ORIENTATION=-
MDNVKESFFTLARRRSSYVKVLEEKVRNATDVTLYASIISAEECSASRASLTKNKSALSDTSAECTSFCSQREALRQKIEALVAIGSRDSVFVEAEAHNSHRIMLETEYYVHDDRCTPHEQRDEMWYFGAPESECGDSYSSSQRCNDATIHFANLGIALDAGGNVASHCESRSRAQSADNFSVSHTQDEKIGTTSWW